MVPLRSVLVVCGLCLVLIVVSFAWKCHGLGIPDMVAIPELTYYESDVGYVGIIKMNYADIIESIRVKHKDISVNVFWQIGDIRGQINSPEPVTYYAAWSKAIGQVVILTMKGLYTLKPQDGEVHVLWEKSLLSSKWRGNGDLSKMFVAGFDVERNESFVSAIDIVKGVSREIKLPSPALEMVFVSDDVGLVTTESSAVKIKYDAREGWIADTIMDGYPTGLRLVGAWGGKPIFAAVAGRSSIIMAGNDTVIVPGEVAAIAAAKQQFVILTAIGDVYRTAGNGAVEKLATINKADIMGWGSCKDGLWVAMTGGEIRAYGLKEEKSAIKVVVPTEKPIRP